MDKKGNILRLHVTAPTDDEETGAGERGGDGATPDPDPEPILDPPLMLCVCV